MSAESFIALGFWTWDLIFLSSEHKIKSHNAQNTRQNFDKVEILHVLLVSFIWNWFGKIESFSGQFLILRLHHVFWEQGCCCKNAHIVCCMISNCMHWLHYTLSNSSHLQIHFSHGIIYSLKVQIKIYKNGYNEP